MEQIKSDLIFDLHPSDGRLLIVNEAEKQKTWHTLALQVIIMNGTHARGTRTWDVRKQLLDFHSSIIIDSR